VEDGLPAEAGLGALESEEPTPTAARGPRTAARSMRAYHEPNGACPSTHVRLFELLTLEGAQAGLSWETILHKREGYRAAFAGFDSPPSPASTRPTSPASSPMPGIVRNRLKIMSTIANAKACLPPRGARSFDAFIWRFVEGRPVVAGYASLGDLPAKTGRLRGDERELKRRGFAFVGPTVCYAFMQAAGLVNDHVTSCFRYAQIEGTAGGGQRQIRSAASGSGEETMAWPLREAALPVVG